MPNGRGRYPRGSLFIYSDDTTYTLNLSKNGKNLIFDSDLMFIHETSAGGASNSRLNPPCKYFYIIRNSFLMNRSLSGFWYVPLCFCTIIIHLYGCIMHCRGTLRTKSLVMIIYGVYDGLRNKYSRRHHALGIINKY